METFLILIGFLACAVAASVAVIKAIETVWFFKEFRETMTKSLDRIEETLRNRKP